MPSAAPSARASTWRSAASGRSRCASAALVAPATPAAGPRCRCRRSWCPCSSPARNSRPRSSRPRPARPHNQEDEWVRGRSGSARRSPRTSERSACGRIVIRSASADRPARDPEALRRVLGRAHFARGRWTFDPARRGPGVRELRWKGAHAPEDGDWIIAEIPWHGPAHLVEVLGADDRPEWDDAAVASQYRLRVTFPDAALVEAAACHEPAARDLKGREDHRDDVVVTVDPRYGGDHDDALGVRALGGGRHEVGVHIADVSWYVRPGSPLDLEARARGTSCYLPGGAVPMLPERLSGDLCSLREGVDRLALSVFATLDESGRLHEYRFAATAISITGRLPTERAHRRLVSGETL